MAIDRALADFQAHRKELLGELERVDRAIAALTGGPLLKRRARRTDTTAPVGKAAAPLNRGGGPKRGKVSEETRAKLPEAWARRKAQATAQSDASGAASQAQGAGDTA